MEKSNFLIENFFNYLNLIKHSKINNNKEAHEKPYICITHSRYLQNLIFLLKTIYHVVSSNMQENNIKKY